MSFNGLGRGERAVWIFLLFSWGATDVLLAQQPQPRISKFEKDQVLQMLNTVSSDVKKHYYDPKMHQVDWDASIQNFRGRIENAASLNRGLSEVAAALDVLNDSHTFFLPPPRPYKHDYGWRIAMVGEKCLVLGVRPQSDAEIKGVKPGDQVVAINGFAPARENLWKMNFVYNVLRPQPSLHVSLLSPSGDRKDLEIVAAMRQLQHTRDLTGEGIWDYIRDLQSEGELGKMRYAELEGDVMALRFSGFAFTQSEVDVAMKKARHHKALVMDLRGNGGGAVSTLNEFLGNLFEHDVKICDRVTRDNSKPETAKSRGKDAFTGKLVVLVDSRSGSASEILARVVQIEKRGTIVGDKSAGAVMEARRYSYKLGLDTIVPYGASITDADLIMTDGKSLEHEGVTPDEIHLPTPADLAAGRDVALARAVEIAGGKISLEDAGKLMPFEWPKN